MAEDSVYLIARKLRFGRAVQISKSSSNEEKVFINIF